MNPFSLSLRRLRAVCAARVSSARVAPSRAGGALAFTVAVGVIACGDSPDNTALTTPEAGAPAFVGPVPGAFDAGVVLPGSGVAPGQVYTLDSGFSVGSFGGANGQFGGTNPGAGGAAAIGGLTAGGLPVNGGATGGTAPIGGLAGLLGGTAGLGGFTAGAGAAAGGGFGGIPGFTGGGGGAAMPVMPLDPSVKQPPESKLPKVTGTCPALNSGYATVNGTTVQLSVGSKPGPVLFYWHGTGGSPSEVEQGVPGATSAVRSNGGLVASFGDTNGKGDLTGNAVWYTGDIESADQILACAIQKGIVDTGRIYTAGYSAGGLQAGTMLLQRSQYIAAAIVYSGGPPLGGLVPGGTSFSDPSHIPAMIGAHGAQGSDWLVLDFYDGTNLLGDTVKKAGGYAMDCDDGGDHAIAWISTRAGVGGQAMKFFQDHPYNTKPSPYAGAVPAGYPRYCKNK